MEDAKEFKIGAQDAWSWSDGTLYYADCFDLLTLAEAGSIDLILCDPPYGVTSAAFDSALDLQKLWPKLWRVARPHCPIILTASQPFSSVLTVSQLDTFKHEWVWIKNAGSNFANTVREPMKEHEPRACVTAPIIGLPALSRIANARLDTECRIATRCLLIE